MIAQHGPEHLWTSSTFLLATVYGTRSLDIIHVATAKLARIEEFISFDLAKEISLQR